jgi:cytochrome c-type biogenesis protein CcmH/NrfG
MQLAIPTRGKKIAVLLAASFLAALYIGISALQFLAAHYSEKNDLASLERAVRLQPGNSEYRYRLARYLSLTQSTPDIVASAYRAAVALNPHRARYWFELAGAYQLMSDTQGQADALNRAVLADPKTPDVAWQAANFSLVQGDNDRALQEFRVVLENDPTFAPTALQLCWRVNPDIDTILSKAMPSDPQSYYALLDLMMAKKEPAAAAKTWAQLVQLQKPIDSGRVFEYIRYLVAQQDINQARTVWREAGALSGLSAYQPSRQNLVVNGDFSLPVLNGGFDWIYYRSKEVELALDPTQAHSGNRSLAIVFDSRALEDAGIRQLVPVEPNTTYDFSANFKAQDMLGAGGPRFAVQDVYGEQIYFASDDLKNADFWKSVSGGFTTGPEAKLVVVRIQRNPPGSAIKGKLWIDGVKMVERQNP